MYCYRGDGAVELQIVPSVTITRSLSTTFLASRVQRWRQEEMSWPSAMRRRLWPASIWRTPLISCISLIFELTMPLSMEKSGSSGPYWTHRGAVVDAHHILQVASRRESERSDVAQASP